MLLFELLRLLGVTLFHLLFLCIIVILPGCLLVFIFLLLLELLVILRLLGGQLGLLLLIFVVSCGVASVRLSKLVLLQFASVTVSACRGSSVICRMIFRAWRASFPGCASLLRAALDGGALYAPPACLDATTPVLKSAGFAVAAIGGLPSFAEARSSGLLRAC
jgi:hypothetical protein